MKYIKLFESASPVDYFKELEEKTAIGIRGNWVGDN